MRTVEAMTVAHALREVRCFCLSRVTRTLLLFVALAGCGATAAPRTPASLSVEDARESTRRAIAERGLDRVWSTNRLRNDRCPPRLTGRFVVLPFGDSARSHDGESDPLEVRERETGRVVWSAQSAAGGLVCPVVHNDAIVFARSVVESPPGQDERGNSTYRERNELVVADLASGNVRCRSVQPNPIIADGCDLVSFRSEPVSP